MVPRLRPLLVISCDAGCGGQQSRGIKALSAEETPDLLAGRGMGAARAARALDCTLVYALVPNGSLDGLVREQARKVAAETVFRVDHSMKLEGQACRPERWKKSGNGWLKNCCGVRAGYGTSCERSRLIEKEMRRRSLINTTLNANGRKSFSMGNSYSAR